MNEKCFGMMKSGECGALRVEKCPGYKKCGFYKPLWRYLRDQEVANVRLCALPLVHQVHIAEKYYEGKMPWKGGRVCV